MSQKTIQLSFFVSLTLGLLVLSFFLFKPYLSVIFISVVLTVAFYPLYEYLIIKFKGHKNLSALLTIAVMTVVIVLPVIWLSKNLFSEAVSLYNSLAFGGGGEKVIQSINNFSQELAAFLPEGVAYDFHIEDYLKNVLEWVISHFDSIFAAVFEGILGFVLMLLSVYYMLLNGSYIKKELIQWSPLPDLYDNEVLSALRSSIDAVIRGRFLVSIAQGVFMGLGFFMFGLANPVLWGFVTGIVSLIPTLGTAVITIPAAAYLLATGHTGAAIGILVWGSLAVGLIDNVLAFFIFKKSIRINPLIILFSILGGVSLFGPVGFLAGPVLVSALISIMRLYPFIMYRGKLGENG